jgi:hypothetical protein
MSEFTTKNTYYVGQVTKETCWAAAYETMIRHKGGDPAKVKTLPNYKEMCSRGILDGEFAACRDHIGLTSTRYTFFKDITNLEHSLRTHGPLWVSGFYCEGHKHIVVIGGVRIDDTEDQDDDDNEILMFDPWRAYNGAKAEPKWFPYSYFRNKLNPVSYSCQHWD